ncbi:hypothetical protein BDN70DRAFT_886986 [Pholiota conissans]|uniref:F-box domain-containing protein n=1 Tax=Pholiota conissans TaxID=109636 RepID=A0A9P5YP00_9AGAR|nr:hypothetical protein BDN70DRAFT_886986 [Pholiota conissans]
MTPPVQVQPPRLPPDLPLEIWLEIFQFATYIYHDVTVAPLDPFTPKHTVTNAMGANTPALAMRTKLALVQVSKAWRRLALQTLYQTLFIRSPTRAGIILQNLERSHRPPPSSSELDQADILGYGQFVRHIVIFTFTRGSDDIQFLQLVFKILCLCPKLRILSGRWMHTLPIEFLHALSRLLGSSLSELYWGESRHFEDLHTRADPTFLASFQQLRVLDLRDFVGSLSSSWPSSNSKTTLPLVQTLILSSNPTSLEAATLLVLPSLQRLTLRHTIWDDSVKELLTMFLRNHGQSLFMIDLPSRYIDCEPHPSMSGLAPNRVGNGIDPDIFLAPGICPNLETIVFSISSPPIEPHTHPNLRRIGLHGVNVDGLYPDKASQTKDHLMAINIDRYPNLESIQTVDFLVDAHADTLVKDIFIWWVERFETMGVLFVDGEGVMWAYNEAIPNDTIELEDGSVHNNSVTALSKLEPGNESKQNKKFKLESDDSQRSPTY